MKKFAFVAVAFLAPTPAFAQFSGPYQAPAQNERFVSEDMRNQINTNDDRVAVGSTGDLNAAGERLICRRAQHDTQSRMSRAPRICLTAREWRRRQ